MIRFRSWKKVGKNYKCPFHTDHLKSAIYNIEEDVFTCLCCKKNGTGDQLFNKEIEQNVQNNME